MFECCLKALPLMSKESTRSHPSRPSSTDKMAESNSQLSAADFSANRVLQRYTAVEERVATERPYVVRAIRPEELHQAYEIRLRTNYIFSKSGIEAAWKISPDHFLVAVNERDVVIGSASWYEFGKGLLLLDQLTVKPEYHGKGVGKELLTGVLEVVTCNFFIRIPVRVEEVFVKAMPPFPYRCPVPFVGTWPTVLKDDLLAVKLNKVQLVDFDEKLLDDLIKYDEDVLRCDRNNLVRHMVHVEGAKCKVAIKERKGTINVVGYGVMQEMSNGSGDVCILLGNGRNVAVGLLRALVDAFPAARTTGCMVTSPALPDVNRCFAQLLNFRTRQSYVYEILAGLAQLEISEDILYLGLFLLPKGVYDWKHISELCQLSIERNAGYNVFLRMIEEMNQSGYFADSFSIHSKITLQQAAAEKIEANRLVLRVPGVTVADFRLDLVRDMVAYDELIMNCKRYDYINAVTSDRRTLTKVAFENDAVCGFIILQHLPGGQALAEHLVANDRHVAKLLLRKAMDEFAPAKNGITLVVPRRPKEAFVNLADDLKLVVERRSFLAYSRYTLCFEYQKVFSIAEFI